MKARIIVAGTVVAIAITSVALAQGGAPSIQVERITGRTERIVRDGPDETAVIFIAKFMCGTPTLNELAPGRYFTAINVRNRLNGSVDLTIGVTRTNGKREIVDPVPLSSLEGRGGLEVDCAEIATLLKSGQNGDLLKGFVEIRFLINRARARQLRRAGVEDFLEVLDVIGVYTATAAP